MMDWEAPGRESTPRPAAVAGSFYPAAPARLAELVVALDEAASRLPGVASRSTDGHPAGIMVPHAGLVYSGVPAAAGWRTLRVPDGAARDVVLDGAARDARTPPDREAARQTIVILGTNHGAGWLDGVGAWDLGPWAMPAGEIEVDHALTAAVLALGEGFTADPAAHAGEHSIEVQLPLLAATAPGARLVALAVSYGSGDRATRAGERLGRLLASRRAAGEAVVLAISSDMAHYPEAAVCEAVTERLWPAIAAVDPERLALDERDVRRSGLPGVVCGMCGIEPAVLGLAALRAMGAVRGTRIAASTSADAGGRPDRTVGYLAVRFDG